MNNIIDLTPNAIIEEDYEGILVLPAWIGFQNRLGHYGPIESETSSNGTVKVRVEADFINNAIVCSQAQANAIQFLHNNSEKIRNAVLDGLLNEMPKLKDIYEELLPDINSREGFNDHLGLSFLHIMPGQKDGFSYIGFELDASWEEEHGVGIMMHKDRVVSIGFADIAFDSWVTYEDNGTIEEETKKWKKQQAAYKESLKKENKVKPWWKFW